ncbi:6-phospho-beta-glucosidase [Paenibacillus sp. CCS19]|uniref:family 4 glycosyl hydrolase n=1 Tax=Paenibacillus sp. CCS19 TaxID=3158387 RepID=UPI00255E8106|nr:hypothetical protein [Paenibacillus cellulosilyticus]GMK37286.1 6-phospho-beta-glucosidase [Paenibacillus cellulosilyticus]
MKIVLIGGGSFVFAPTVLEDAIVKHKLEGSLILVDPNIAAAEAMAAAGRRIAKELGVQLEIQATSERLEALREADFVIVSASPQGAKRWCMDFEYLSSIGLADQARECGGIGGLLNSLRAISLVLDVCGDMERLCPKAMLLVVTNPMPRVVTAVQQYTSIRVVGFCNIAYRGADGYRLIPHLLGRSPESLDIVTGGLNHFAWICSIRDRRTGEDLLPQLTERIQNGTWEQFDSSIQRELAIMRNWYSEYGGIAAGAVDHHAEYLPFVASIHYPTAPPYHGTEEERKQRMIEIQHIADGKVDWKELFQHSSWEHPVDLAIALHTRKSEYFDILNIRNDGAIPYLPDERIVEVPVKVSNGKLAAIPLNPFPDKLANLIRQVSDVHSLVAASAATGSREAAREAMLRDPAIVDKEKALQAFDHQLAVHADLLPRFKF